MIRREMLDLWFQTCTETLNEIFLGRNVHSLKEGQSVQKPKYCSKKLVTNKRLNALSKDIQAKIISSLLFYHYVAASVLSNLPQVSVASSNIQKLYLIPNIIFPYFRCHISC